MCSKTIISALKGKCKKFIYYIWSNGKGVGIQKMSPIKIWKIYINCLGEDGKSVPIMGTHKGFEAGKGVGMGRGQREW